MTRDLETFCSLLSQYKCEPVLHRIVICNEKCILFDKWKCSSWSLDRDKVSKHNSQTEKYIYYKKIKMLMAFIWWSSADVVYYIFMSPGMSIAANVYITPLKIMMRELEIKEATLVNRHTPILLQYNARSHLEQRTLHQLEEVNLKVLCHSPYSLDLAPSESHIYQTLDNVFYGKNLQI